MADVDYNYTKSPVALDRIELEIRASAIVTALRHVSLLGTNQLTITMADGLSDGDAAILDALVAAHAGVPIVYPLPTIALGEPKDSKGRLITSASAFAVNIDYEVKATGFSGTAAHGATTDIHHAIGSEDRYINGLELFAQGAAMGDTVDFMVTDQNNYLGYGVGAVLKQFGFNWNVDPGKVAQGLILFNYLARIPAGFFVRVRYKSTGADDVKVACNLSLHRKVT